MSPRKVFALSSALIPVFGVACTTTDYVTLPLDDAGPDARSQPRNPDSGVDAPPPQPESGPCLCGGCTHDEIDATTFPWKPPYVMPGSCTEEELDAFVAFVEKTDDPQKWKDGAWTTNEACRSCIFAKETTTWPPLILNASGQLAELNVGGCIAIASGKEACGKAYQQWRTCYLEACTDCPKGGADSFSKCVTEANKFDCKKAFDAIIPSCGSTQIAADAETACDGEKYVFEGPIRAQCIGLGDGDL